MAQDALSGNAGGRLAGNRCRKNMPVLLIVSHAGNQGFMFGHPRIAEVRKKLTLKYAASVEGRPRSASKVQTVFAISSAGHFGS
jgi:hypothetical protein